MPKYNRKVWLDKDSHSTASIACYYDPQCLNNELALNVSISDCNTRMFFIHGVKYRSNPEKAIPDIRKLLNIFSTIYTDVKKYNDLAQYGKDTELLDSFFGDKKIISHSYWIRKSKELFRLSIHKQIIKLELKQRSGLKIPDDLSKKTKRRWDYKTKLTLHADKETCDLKTFEKKIKIIINELQKFLTFLEEL